MIQAGCQKRDLNKCQAAEVEGIEGAEGSLPRRALRTLGSIFLNTVLNPIKCPEGLASY